MTNGEVIPACYRVFRKDRSRAGDLLLAMRPELSPACKPEFERPDAEPVWVKVTAGRDRLSICAAYRASNSSDNLNKDLIASINSIQNVQHWRLLKRATLI